MKSFEDFQVTPSTSHSTAEYDSSRAQLAHRHPHLDNLMTAEGFFLPDISSKGGGQLKVCPRLKSTLLCYVNTTRWETLEQNCESLFWGRGELGLSCFKVTFIQKPSFYTQFVNNGHVLAMKERKQHIALWGCWRFIDWYVRLYSYSLLLMLRSYEYYCVEMFRMWSLGSKFHKMKWIVLYKVLYVFPNKELHF